MLIDTDVLIWYLRGNERAKKAIEEMDGFSISVITYMEIVQGMRNKSELLIFRRTLHSWGVKIIYLDEDISIKAMNYIEQFYLSHSLELADSLIAATAFTKGLSLFTGNGKHFSVVNGIEINNFKP